MAVPAKTVSEETSPYAVNKPLFDEATAVKDRMKLIEDRLQKMEEHRTEVSDSVYLKVKTDYEVQLDEVRGLFNEKCHDIENELKHLYNAQEVQDSSLSQHQEVLEEAKFRHRLGEYTDKKFKDVESQQNKEIKKYSDLLDTIKASIKQYEEILGRAFEPQAATFEPAPPPKKKVEAALPPPPPVAAPVAKAPPPPPTSSYPTIGKDEDTLKTKNPPYEEFPEAAAPPPLPSMLQEEIAAIPAQESPETAAAFESKLSDELDMFLETEGDYFSQDPDEIQPSAEAPPAAASAPTPKMEPSSPAAVSRTKPVEDSISTILRDIPLEDETGDTMTKTGEDTGSEIDVSGIPAEASLLLIEGDLDESEFILAENTSIGRSPSNDICLKETKVSRQHAAINLRNGNYVMIDLKSSNGILINGRKVEEAVLRDGDEITVGSFKFQFNLA